MRLPIVTAAGVLLLAARASAQYTPAPTPALPPEEAATKFAVPDGFEVRLFAAEPDVVNPVAMTWDTRGRLWVLELYEYPMGAAPGAKGRDRVKILEDTDGDGRADKVTVFADGLNLATGLLLGRGGAFVGQAPDLLFLEDTDGDDVADKRTVLLTGFGLHDRHELLNGFTWGPDGRLYMTQGVFTQSQVWRPDVPGGRPVSLNAAVACYDPATKGFEVFAEGTSNPWGVDFDRAGNAFVSACVIDHLFHMSPGGVYVRQAGAPADPYAYELLPSIVDHKHYRAAYCGVCVYQGDQYPEAYRGTVMMGNIHGNCVNRDKLTPVGSTFKATAEPDFLVSRDGWFRPVSVQTGPDGALWVADWYDKFPCYQNALADPQGVDRRYGRIWRVVYTGGEKGAPRPVKAFDGDLAKLDTAKLVDMLGHPNVWRRRTARRILTERGAGGSDLRDGTARLFRGGPTPEARLEALWTLHGAGALTPGDLDAAARDAEPAIRAWAARLTGERAAAASGKAAPAPADAGARLLALARDPDPSVQAAAAVAARRMGGSVSVAAALAEQPMPAGDLLLPFMIWRAAEPAVASDPKPFLDWLAARGPARMPFAATLANKSMRRICDTRDAAKLDVAVAALPGFAGASPALAVAALGGLLEGQKGDVLRPTSPAAGVLGDLARHADAGVAGRAAQLAAIWGDEATSESLFRPIGDPKADLQARLQGIALARRLKSKAARGPLVAALADGNEQLVTETLRALGDIGGEKVGNDIVGRWPGYPPGARRAAVDVLASRAPWAALLLQAVEDRKIDPVEISQPVRRTLSRYEEPIVRERLVRTIGVYRAKTDEKRWPVEYRKGFVLNGPVDFEAGHALVKKTCLVCHTFLGEGTNVGPDLTGTGRASLEALLTNIIDPSQLIGKGFEQVIVTTKDERIVTGRIIEDTPTQLKLVSAGPKEEIVARSDVDSVQVSDQSLMPEGLEQMPEADFRNLVWYVFCPPQEKDPKVRIEPRERRLVLKARVPGRDERVELEAFRADPGLPPAFSLRDPTGGFAATAEGGITTGFDALNGIDFRPGGAGRHRFTRFTDLQLTNDRATVRASAEWVAPDGAMLLDEDLTVGLSAPDAEDRYRVDVKWQLRARDRAVKVAAGKGGGLVVGGPAGWAPLWTSPGGRADAGGRPAGAWLDGTGAVGDVSFGLALLAHPQNGLREPAWRTGGGWMNPAPAAEEEWTIPPGQTRAWRYRLVVHRGAGGAGIATVEMEKFGAMSAE